jgi:two-component system, LytTR family, sensor kinase
MNLLPNRVPLTLRRPNQLLGVVIISLIAWAQVGFVSDPIRLLFIVTNYLCWFILMPWINGWVHARKGKNSSTLRAGITQLLVILLAHWFISNTLFYLLRFSFLDYQLLPTSLEVSQYLVPSLVSRAIDLALFVGLLTWIYQNNQLHKRKMEVSEKETELQRSKLQSLKNQLNPHFLFNSMHNIAALIGQNNDAAHQLTIKVSHLLRKIMIINELEVHTLEDEWNFVLDYLAIESERFQDRLILTKSFQESIKEQKVPTLILQPLVENAFKHGVANAINPTPLEVSVYSEQEKIYIKVTNEVFPNASITSSNGVGLNNLKERLWSFYGEKAQFSTQSNDKFEAIITLPRDQ